MFIKLMGKVFKFLVSLINMDVKKIEEQKRFIEENSLEVIAQGTATEFVGEEFIYQASTEEYKQN